MPELRVAWLRGWEIRRDHGVATPNRLIRRRSRLNSAVVAPPTKLESISIILYIKSISLPVRLRHHLTLLLYPVLEIIQPRFLYPGIKGFLLFPGADFRSRCSYRRSVRFDTLRY